SLDKDSCHNIVDNNKGLERSETAREVRGMGKYGKHMAHNASQQGWTTLSQWSISDTFRFITVTNLQLRSENCVFCIHTTVYSRYLPQTGLSKYEYGSCVTIPVKTVGCEKQEFNQNLKLNASTYVIYKFGG
ncbi:hypothetical protein STEG23_011959, partial [Scotinomys teguina]